MIPVIRMNFAISVHIIIKYNYIFYFKDRVSYRNYLNFFSSFYLHLFIQSFCYYYKHLYLIGMIGVLRWSVTLLLLTWITTSSAAKSPADGKPTGSNACISKQTCHECIQTPTCAWCSMPVSYNYLRHLL